jgi:hypothetical protein
VSMRPWRLADNQEPRGRVGMQNRPWFHLQLALARAAVSDECQLSSEESQSPATNESIRQR